MLQYWSLPKNISVPWQLPIVFVDEQILTSECGFGFLAICLVDQYDASLDICIRLSITFFHVVDSRM